MVQLNPDKHIFLEKEIMISNVQVINLGDGVLLTARKVS